MIPPAAGRSAGWFVGVAALTAAGWVEGWFVGVAALAVGVAWRTGVGVGGGVGLVGAGVGGAVGLMGGGVGWRLEIL